MIKLTDWIPHIGFIPKEIPLNLFLDHFRFRKTQEDLELDNPVSPILLTRTTHAAPNCSFSMKISKQHARHTQHYSPGDQASTL